MNLINAAKGTYRRSVLSVAAAVLAAVLVALPGSAEASLILKIEDSIGNSITVADGGIRDFIGVTEELGYYGSLGNWKTTSAIVDATPVLGLPNQFEMDMVSLAVSGKVGGTLKIWLTKTDVSDSVGYQKTIAAIGGTTDGTVKYSAFLDTSNTAFGTEILLAQLGEYNANSLLPGGGFSGGVAGSVVTGSLYSVTQLVEITHEIGNMATSFNATITVPEPSALGLFGLGLLVLAGFVRRYRLTG